MVELWVNRWGVLLHVDDVVAVLGIQQPVRNECVSKSVTEQGYIL